MDDAGVVGLSMSVQLASVPHMATTVIVTFRIARRLGSGGPGTVQSVPDTSVAVFQASSRIQARGGESSRNVGWRHGFLGGLKVR
jgi:hypothetical protein